MRESPALIASYFTLAGDIIPFATTAPSPFGLQERAEAAVSAGYVGIGLETSDVRHLSEIHGWSGVRAILESAGISYLELEVLTDWFATGERRQASDLQRSFLLKAASELGVQKIKVIGDAEGGMDNAIERPWTIDQLVDAFGGLCRDAASVGAAISLELVPGTGVRDLGTAQAIVAGAGETNGGMLIDIWHLARGGIPYEDMLAVPARLINAVELDDAMAVQLGSIFEDTIRRRKLPGEGELDVPRFLRCIERTGYSGAYGVEIVSDAQRALNVDEAARLSFKATKAQFEAAHQPMNIPGR